MNFIINNLGTIIVSVVVFAIIAGVIIHIVNNKKKGKSSCSCGCSGCAMKDSCHAGKASNK